MRSAQNILSPALRITRPLNSMLCFVAVFIGGILANPLLKTGLLAASFSALCSCAAGNVINDISDIEIDRINRPSRVLPSGLMSIKSAYYLYLSLILCSLGLALLTNLYCFLIVIFTNILLILYSLKLKSIPLLGNISVALLSGLAFLFGSISSGGFREGIMPAALAFCANFAREIIKDIEDIKGDKALGSLSFASRKGLGPSIRLIRASLLCLMVLCLVPYYFKYYSIEYFVIITAVVIPSVLQSWKLLSDRSKNYLKDASTLLKFCMLAGLIAILLGS